MIKVVFYIYTIFRVNKRILSITPCEKCTINLGWSYLPRLNQMFAFCSGWGSFFSTKETAKWSTFAVNWKLIVCEDFSTGYNSLVRITLLTLHMKYYRFHRLELFLFKMKLKHKRCGAFKVLCFTLKYQQITIMIRK